MEMNIRSITIVVAVLVMSAVAGSAQDWTKGSQGSTVWTIPNSQPRAQSSQGQTGGSQFFLTRGLYAAIDFGGTYQQDTTLDESQVTSTSSTNTSSTATFNTGIRADFELGYNINNSWAAEFDTGLVWNSMDKVNGVALSSLSYPNNASLDTYTVPFLAQILYKVPLKGSWSPYVGIGVGGATTILSYTQAGYSMGDYSFVFAYQAEAGLRYAFSKNASVGIDYKFLGTTDPSWQFNQFIGAQTDFHFKEKGFYTHSLAVSLTWTF